MGPRTCSFATLVLLLVAAGDAHLKSGHGGRSREGHSTGKGPSGAKQEMDHSVTTGQQLQTLKEAKIIEFDFRGNEKLEEELRASGRYDPKMVLAYDVTMDNYQRDRIIATTPHVRRGIPFTLSTIPFDGVKNPKATPYPNMKIHRTAEESITDCDNQLVDVIKTTKTSTDDGTLYVLDNGVLDITTSPKNVCPPKIVIIDLKIDVVTKSITIKNAACNSLYSNLLVEEYTAGSVTVYSSDAQTNVLTVTDVATGASRHLRSQYFHPTPGFFFTEAGGPSSYLPYGMCGLAADRGHDGRLYFQAYATDVQGVVEKQVVRDAADGDVLDTKAQLLLPGELNGPSGDMAMDHTRQLLFFPDQDRTAILCWNTSKPHDPKNFRVIAQDSERLQFVSSLTVETETQRLYAVSNRFTYYVSNTRNYSEVNYRIMYINLIGMEC